jgi:hypothetical protein
MINTENQHYLTIEITPEHHQTAHKFAVQQGTTEKARKVYLNTLAVYAVQSFLNWIHIETNLEDSDSWNPAIRCFQDVADLIIPDLGKLECCLLLDDAEFINIPAGIIEDRIGYVVVKFPDVNQAINQVEILGFSRSLSASQTQIVIRNLEPIEELIDYIFQLELDSEDVTVSAITSTSKNIVPNLPTINLSKWLENIENIVASGLQTLDAYLRNQPENLVFRFATAPRSRSNENQQQVSVSGVEEIEIAEHSLVLVINCQIESEQIRDIRLRLYPKGESKYLPMGLKLIVLDESGEVFIEAQARESDNWIQLEFTGEPQETFGVEVVMNENIFTRNFVI